MNSWTNGSGNLKVEKTKELWCAPQERFCHSCSGWGSVGNAGGRKSFTINNLYQHFFHLTSFVENFLHQPLPQGHRDRKEGSLPWKKFQGVKLTKRREKSEKLDQVRVILIQLLTCIIYHCQPAQVAVLHSITQVLGYLCCNFYSFAAADSVYTFLAFTWCIYEQLKQTERSLSAKSTCNFP